MYGRERSYHEQPNAAGSPLTVPCGPQDRRNVRVGAGGWSHPEGRLAAAAGARNRSVMSAPAAGAHGAGATSFGWKAKKRQKVEPTALAEELAANIAAEEVSARARMASRA